MSRIFHEYNAARERKAFANARIIVVPSEGLRRDLVAAYPDTAAKISVIHNPVDLEHFTKPAAFEAATERARHSFDADDIVLVFVAKAGFGRKGLAPLLAALARCPSHRMKLLVVGGTEHERAESQRYAKALKLDHRVVFTGPQSDVRSKLWCSDVYAAPSTYEALSLAALEAAAAGLPLLATPVSGMEEILSPRTGWEIQSSVDSIASALTAIAATPRHAIRERGAQAREVVEVYNLSNFVDGWRECLLRASTESG